MSNRLRTIRLLRWILSIVLVATGLSVVWAWGQVSRLAEPQVGEVTSLPTAVYAAWQPADVDEVSLFRSTDGGATWQSLPLPGESVPLAWADDGRNRVAVALADGSVLESEDQGETWAVGAVGLPVLSLAWSPAGDLYLGTEGQGIHRLAADGDLAVLPGIQGELAQASVQHMALSGGRLFATTPTVLFYTDISEIENGIPIDWTKSMPIPGMISALAVSGPELVFVGTETVGVYRSTDAGQTWQPATDGLGLAAGQMVKITALRADPQEPGLLYAAVSYVLGSTQVYLSPEGVFSTLDSGDSWQRLAGPTFPDAVQSLSLVVDVERPLYVQAVTADGLQEYEPDVVAALAALNSDDPQLRVMAARTLGLARSKEAGHALLAALTDPEPAVSLAAANALGRIADPETASALLTTLEHPDEQVRLGAARALGIMGVEGAVEPLRTMLLNGRGASVTVAAEALGQIGSPAATDALLVALSDRSVTSRRHAALAALEGMGDEAVPALARMLGSKDGYDRRNAAQALGWVRSPLATPELVELLDDQNDAVREQAVWALGQVGDPAARPALERLQSRDPSAAVQSAAESALVRIGQQPHATVPWPASWAPTLNRLQPVRWFILVLSLVGAAWLALRNTRLSPVPVIPRQGRP
jgi:HEAT repeat protein/photosystem II stability/assembly factor-like uncharacterized protein